MNRDQVIERINYFLNREAHSLTTYVLEAEPYVKPGQTYAIKELQSVAAQERKRAETLMRVMADVLSAPPADRQYPSIVADMNYLSLPYLLELIVKGKERLIDEYEMFLAQTGGLADWATVREVVARAAQESRYDLEHLRSLMSRLKAENDNTAGAKDSAAPADATPAESSS